jgi:uncharacterized protein (UPF0305 family)
MKFLQKQTVASVMAVFTKTISELQAIEQAAKDEIKRQEEIVEKAKEAIGQATTEQYKASTISKKLEALLVA